MTSTNIDGAKLFYGRHFPDILSTEPDPETNEYSVKNPLNSNKNDLQIDTLGMFTAKNPPYRGFVSDFLMLAEGTPEDEAFEEVEKIKNINLPPTLADIQIWHTELLSPAGKQLLDYLMKERGLTLATIKKYQLGFNATENELVFPALNITRKNPIAVKFTKFPFTSTASKNKIRIVGPSYLLGYHKLKFNRDPKTPKYITTNEIDALYLRQQGFETYCSLKDLCDLDPDWYKLFKNLDVVIFSSYEEESLINTMELANSGVNSIKRFNNRRDYLSDFFIKENKTINNFDDEVKKSQELNTNYFMSMDALRVLETEEDTAEYIDGPQDFSNLGFIYGAKFKDKYFFLTSQKHFLTENKLQENGILKTKDFDKSGITKELAEKFTQQNKTVKVSHVFNAVKKYIKKYIFFKDESNYDLLTAWVMGTYMFTAFRHFPYIHLQAEKNSGKSQLMEIMYPICFNGKTFIDPTGAVIFREADKNKSTMFIDESENLQDRSGHSNLMELLNSGFQKGSTVTRIASAAKGGTSTYSVYSPKMFAGIKDMNDVLQSRSIHIDMLRKLPGEKVDRYTNDKATINIQKNLREDLYMFGLQYAEGIREIYNNKLNSIDKLKDLDNRQYDIWSPLFVIASIIDQENGNTLLSDSLSSCVNSQKEVQAEKDSRENPTSRILNKMDAILNNISYIKKDGNNDQLVLEYLTDDIYNEFSNDAEWRKEVGSKNKLTSLLGKVEIKVKNENVKGKTERCYVFDVNKLIEFGKRYGVQFTFNNKFSIKGKASSLYVPDRVIVTKDSANSPLTQDILARLKQLNPNIQVIQSKDERPELPQALVPTEQNEYIRQTLVLATRKSPFIFTFPSPGNIVEGMTTILQLSYFCNSNCTFCYLHTAGQDPIRWRKMYTNLDEMDSQIEKEQFVHRAALTLWSAVSFYKQESLAKIPDGFNDIIDEMRREFNSDKSKIENDADVKKYLSDTLADKLAKLGLEIDYKKLEPIKRDIPHYYKENSKHKLWFNVSEFSDIVKADHISNNLEYLMQLVQKNKDFRFKFHTQSTNIDNMLKYPGDNRVEITMDFNTDYVINKYCEGTSSLDERIEAAKKILAKKGFGLKISIEPIITYNGYENDYKELAERLIKELDLSSDQVKSIKFGCVRIAPILMTMIKSNFPGTELFDEATPLEQPIPPDPKHRYTLEVRKNIYKILLDTLSIYHNKTYISCELPELWKILGQNFVEHIKNAVYQFPG